MTAVLRRYFRAAKLNTMEDVVAGKKYVYHFDHQGCTQALTDATTGAVTDRFASDAWGVPVKRTGTSLNRNWYVGDEGYYRQADRILDYVRARHYVPVMGSWLSEDPQYCSMAMNISTRESFSLYVYAVNNPIANVDPNGLKACRVYGKNPPTLRDDFDCERGDGFTSCDGKGGTYTAICDCECPETVMKCIKAHEDVHSIQLASCCARYALCIRKKRSDCRLVMGNWFTANENYLECEAYKASESCFRNTYKNYCATSGYAPIPDKKKRCCDLLHRGIGQDDFFGGEHCVLSNGPVPCYLDPKGDPIHPYPTPKPRPKPKR